MNGTDIAVTLEGTTTLKDGDFALEYDLNEAVTNRMLRTSLGSWSYDPDIGIGLQDFAGRPNTAQTGQEIEDAVVTGLAKVSIESQCVVYPTAKEAVAIMVLVLTDQGVKKLPFSFTYEDGLVTYTTSEVQDAGYPTQTPLNKYMRRYKKE